MQRVQEDEHWVVIGDAPDRPGLAFQRVAGIWPPQWPDPEHPQQMHLDVRVSDLDEAEKAAPALGARKLPGRGERFRVLGDPAGHPFCLVSFEPWPAPSLAGRQRVREGAARPAGRIKEMTRLSAGWARRC